MSDIALTNGKDRVNGTLVIESSTAYQVAVDGRVGVYLKSEWAPLTDTWRNLADTLEDILGGFRR